MRDVKEVAGSRVAVVDGMDGRRRIWRAHWQRNREDALGWVGPDRTGDACNCWNVRCLGFGLSGSAGGGEVAVSNPNTMVPSVMADIKRTVVTLSRDFCAVQVLARRKRSRSDKNSTSNSPRAMRDVRFEYHYGCLVPTRALLPFCRDLSCTPCSLHGGLLP